MKKIAIVHPRLGFGGPTAVTVGMLEALKRDYHLHLITTAYPNLYEINSFFNTVLNWEDITIHEIQTPIIASSSRLALLKKHFLMRYCKQNNAKFDLLISSYGEMDFGKRGIQYIHFPEIETEALFVLPKGFYRRPFVRKLHTKICKLISNYSITQVINNVTIVNSHWTKNVVDKTYAIDSKVVYPPIEDNFEQIDWKEKENGFIFVGRMSPDKRPVETLEILERVREAGFDIHIHLIGDAGLDRDYVEKLKSWARDNRSWVFYEGRVSSEALRKIVSKHRYGISGKKFEHFGIAIAEMVKSGSIIFINNDGGQREIVGEEKALIYNSDNEAVKKISDVLANRDLQVELLQKLRKQGDKFSREQFGDKMRKIVENFLEATHKCDRN